MANLRTEAKMGLLSTMTARAMTDNERRMMAMRWTDLVVDPADRALEYATPTYRDARGNRILTSTNATITTLNSRAAAQFVKASPGGLSCAYVLPPSYLVAVAARVDDLANTRALAISENTGGNRSALWVTGNASLNFDHAASTSGAGIATGDGVVTAGTHVFWATYSADTGAAEIGIDAATAHTSGTINVAHKAWARIIFGGSLSSTYASSVTLGYAVVASQYLGGEAYRAQRTAILARLAEACGVSLGA